MVSRRMIMKILTPYGTEENDNENTDALVVNMFTDKQTEYC